MYTREENKAHPLFFACFDSNIYVYVYIYIYLFIYIYIYIYILIYIYIFLLVHLLFKKLAHPRITKKKAPPLHSIKNRGKASSRPRSPSGPRGLQELLVRQSKDAHGRNGILSGPVSI